MTHHPFNFAEARQNMVENQLRPAEVNHVKLIEIMRVLPREECVKDSQREVAYADINIPLSYNRFLSEPRVIARMIQLADIQAGEKVLVIGAGTGYTAAIISFLKADTYAIETDAVLAEQGKVFCQDNALSVKWHIGKLSDNYPYEQLFDVIFIDGAVSIISDILINRLANNGRIVTILQEKDQASHAAFIRKTPQGLSTRLSFYAALPFLTEF